MRLRVTASTMSAIDKHREVSQNDTMKWTIEFMGQQRPLDEVWSDDLAGIIGPYRDRIETAFKAARDPELLNDIEVIFFVDDQNSWGVRFYGQSLAVQYATDIAMPIVKVGTQPN